ncbi:iron hydrogenase [Patescibacteria group bacterium]|nr:iron hydrogenase [Patescibacteria group bacterium]
MTNIETTHSKIFTLKNFKLEHLIYFTVLTTAAVFASLFHNQFITGPIVNATLILCTALIGLRYGVMISLIPSVIAFSTGLLPAVLMPMIPFIMLSNVILVTIFNYFKKNNFWEGLIVGSTAKTAFLFLTSTLIMQTFAPSKTIADQIVIMMSWPQFITALGGGILAFGILKALKK